MLRLLGLACVNSCQRCTSRRAGPGCNGSGYRRSDAGLEGLPPVIQLTFGAAPGIVGAVVGYLRVRPTSVEFQVETGNCSVRNCETREDG